MSLADTSLHKNCDCCGNLLPVVIKGRVGVGGSNKPDDVMAIQQLLNSIAPAEGGPPLILAEDGIIGPKTDAAITRYQNKVLGWADGRVDPDGPTLQHLSKFVCSSPSVPAGRLGVPLAKGKAGAPNKGPSKTPDPNAALAIQVAQICMRVLEPSLHDLRWKLTRLSPPLMALLNKHFASGKHNVTEADAHHVANILGRIHNLIALVHVGGQTEIDSVLQYDAEPDPGVIAFTVRGGDKMSIKQFQIYGTGPHNSILKKFAGHTIWLKPIFADQDRFEKHWTVLHECCHFVGPRDHRGNEINDNGYAFEGKFQTIGKYLRLHNAESLSMFMLEYCIGTDALANIPRFISGGLAKHYDAFPKVAASTHEILMS